MPTDGSVYSLYSQDGLIQGTYHDLVETPSMIIRKDQYNSMVTWEDFRNADKLCNDDFVIPVYEDIFLDAIDERKKYEFRKAILYAAIAVESMLANVYDKEYRRLLSKSPKDKRFRFISLNSEVKDPVFKSLIDRTDFKKLLHEIPLYIFGKSLLIQDENLYSDVLKLYTTRNKIVHWGAPINPNYDQMLEVNEDGAGTAVNIAFTVFNWMGITRFNSIYTNEFIRLEDEQSK